MRRYWVNESDIQDNEVVIEGDLLHHLIDVCRLDVGSKFEVLCNRSKAYFVEMTEVKKRQARAVIKEERAIAPLPKPYIRLAVSVPRFSKLDTIIEKSVELGVASVHPFVSEFSFVRKLNKITQNKRDRWGKVVVAATQQTGRGELMEVQLPVTLQGILEEFNRSESARGLFFFEGEASLWLPEKMAQLKQENFDEIWLFVGSEGGFSHDEVGQFKAAGLQPITVGEQILRVETACLALASIIQYELVMVREGAHGN